MKIRTIAILTLLTVVMGAMAGKKLDLKEMTSGALRGESMSAVRPLADGETYAQLSDDGKRVVRYSYKTGRAAGTLFDVAAVGEPHLEQLDGYLLSQDCRRMLIQTATKRIYRHSSTAEYYVYDLGGQHLTHLSEGGAQQTPLFSPDGRQVAFVRDNNIFLTGDGEEVQVTRDGKKNEVINGIPDWVNEEEFGHSRAMVFTADGRYLVWVRYDESAVKEYSMPTFRYKYPFAGDQNSSVSVWCYDITTRQTRRVAVPLDNDGYIPRLVMTPDAGQVAVYTLNRHQDHLCIYMADMTTADCRLTIEERINKYVREEVLDGIHIGKRHILLPSDRDGYMHLYLYDRSGQLLRQVESGDYEVSAVYGMDEKSGDVYYASHEWGATDQQVWVARKDGRRECLTAQKGWNTAIFSKNFKYFIKTWSDLNTPAVYALCDNKGRTLTTLIDNHALRESWAAYEQGERSLFTLTTSEGVTLNGWLIKPADFDATKQYPVVMYQYGGPGNQQVKNAWGIGMMGQGALLEQYLCQLGFVCVCIDGRGTGGRSADFEKSTYLKLGFQEARDQVESALWLARQPWVDGQRIGIWGWSFGGFNTLMSMSEGRDVFCCGIAIAPPTSWRYYDTIYTERYMRTPQENAEGYDDNPISRAEKLHGALLLCHGSGDDNVHFRNTEEYTDALVKADKDFRQLVYTNRNHSIYGGNTRNHLFRQCVNFFLEKMK